MIYTLSINEVMHLYFIRYDLNLQQCLIVIVGKIRLFQVM